MRATLFHIILTLALTMSAPARAEDRAAAREAFRRGSQHYKLGEYRDALAEFKTAYRNYEDPTFLFNIAQCERQLDLRTEAVHAYRAFLSDAPDAPNRGEVKELIAKLEREIADERSNKAAPPTTVLSPPAADKTAPTAVLSPLAADTVAATSPTAPTTPAAAQLTAGVPPEKRPLHKRPWFWATLAGAAVAVGTGVALGVVYGSPAKTLSPSLGAVQAN
jgi:tetratricopeptide (TPR) repeat protein